jgi:hypothetical protein
VTATERPLTEGERALAASKFGNAIDYEPVRIHRRSWFPFQPRNVAMAPSGHIHFHPKGDLWCEDFARQPLWRQSLFMHEMVHVWQAQKSGRLYLVLMRHPFCRYSYSLRPGWPLKRYGLEQQAEIVRHAFMLRRGAAVPGAPPMAQYETILPFRAL